MKYCVKCGTELDDQMTFCHKCGHKCPEEVVEKKEAPSVHQPEQDASDKPQKGGSVAKIFFSVALITIAVIAIVVSASLLFFSDKKSKTNSASSSAKTEELFEKEIADEALRADFLNACEQIGMNPADIKEFEKVDSWAGGDRYSFLYKNMGFRLYANANSTVKDIKLGADTDIYKQGYEPYQVDDYIVDTEVADKLRGLTEEYVKNQLNYPATADFALLDWSYGRDHELYLVSSQGTAENGFGVKQDILFSLLYTVEGDTVSLVLFNLNGNVIIDKMDTVVTPDRQQVASSSPISGIPDDGSILLEDGELGDYGKTVELDGQTYTNFYVPAGTYKVVNKGRFCKVYVAKDEYYKNESGYAANDVIATVEFSESGEENTITVGEGEHIELTINGIVALYPQ